MGRVVKNWKSIKASEAVVAEHRYLWSGVVDANGERLPDISDAKGYMERFACIPYREGEVVYIERNGKAAKALIYAILYEFDRYGDFREYYRVQVETASGEFSKLWEKAYPGYIQRGYKMAGLAPDIPY